MSTSRRPTLRQAAAFLILGSFVAFVLLLGISNQTSSEYGQAGLLDVSKPSSEKPNFAQYVHLRTLSDEELDFDNSERRVIIVGDVHGMKDSFDKLLKKLKYTSSTDLLIHAGDVVAKGPLSGSLDVLAYLAAHNVTGVRGNHDQMVLEWRAWVENVLAQPDGAKWLAEMELKPSKERKRYKGKEAWQRIPDGWDLMGDHYRIARALSAAQYAYLRTLPLVLHVPRLHAFVVHAGLLPLDPRRSPTSVLQPLAHAPLSEYSHPDGKNDTANVTQLRTTQERALLSDVPQNVDPWVLLNMRSIRKDNSISKDAKVGTAWAPLWNAIVSRCGGFDLELDFSDSIEDEYVDKLSLYQKSKGKSKKSVLPCHPSTVIYGHAASRGLDIKRWTKGLDSGCVYGRRLTALVLTPPGPDTEANTALKSDKMHFGDAAWPRTADARLVSVSCLDP